MSKNPFNPPFKCRWRKRTYPRWDRHQLRIPTWNAWQPHVFLRKHQTHWFKLKNKSTFLFVATNNTRSLLTDHQLADCENKCNKLKFYEFECFENEFFPAVRCHILTVNLPSHALALLDNCPGHPPADILVSENGNVFAMFLQPNTTACLQSMTWNVAQSV